MIDLTKLIEQLGEANSSLDSLAKQRAHIDEQSDALKAFITATERLVKLARLPEASSSRVLDESPLVSRPSDGRETSVTRHPKGGSYGTRDTVLQIMREASGPIELQDIWDRASSAGITTTVTPPWRAAYFAVHELMRRGQPIRRVGASKYELVGTKADNAPTEARENSEVSA